jgi:hypothetical protein
MNPKLQQITNSASDAPKYIIITIDAAKHHYLQKHLKHPDVQQITNSTPDSATNANKYEFGCTETT